MCKNRCFYLEIAIKVPQPHGNGANITAASLVNTPHNPISSRIYIREVSTQNKIEWGVETATETAERTYPIPPVIDGNANIEELENIPAYIRKKIKMDNQVAGTEKEVSKYTLASDT